MTAGKPFQHPAPFFWEGVTHRERNTDPRDKPAGAPLPVEPLFCGAEALLPAVPAAGRHPQTFDAVSKAGYNDISAGAQHVRCAANKRERKCQPCRRDLRS